MGAYLLDWVALFFRWFHVIAGVAWIGASFYFVWLDMSLRKPPQWKADKGISGDLWAVHGGGFYEIAKYKLEPEEMPKTLHWFKWEAYTTWLTGMAMLAIVYYFNATAYLIDPSKVAFGSSIGAISTSLLFLFGSYFLYEVIVRSRLGKNSLIFSSIIFILLVIACWGSYQLFSDRASFIHIGAILGTVMAGNVFFGIMPAQRALVDCVRRGVKPGKEVADLALQAKNRSLMNNYFTLPLIFTMISNHYPMMYSHAHGWLVLVFVGIITATVRHYFNQKHLGHHKPKFLWIPALATVLLIIWMRPAPVEPLPAASASVSTANATPDTTSDTTPPVTAGSADNSEMSAATETGAANEAATEVVPVTASADDAIMDIVHTRCTTCHAAQPTQQGFAAPPAGIILQTPADMKIHQDKIVTAVQTGYMPLGNLTQLTDAERQQLVAYASGL
ncbi:MULTISPECIES: urate hydroxylase PuuD [Psychrobacter]|uniref:Urate hydroxylase PuuD n=1 Tax=Psychrobacter communis TaxID=2762238 RepID=A0ABR8RGZ6_9GAMM|nr:MULTISPECIES: urate hydroxylase PuuD [Psychrobacter]MBD7947074.1 urate hydroxylase PuuD [Psychrobacter communis]MBK3394120.1 urate hydroxylase PuuD [Psychrobacter sp. M9-54-1]